jgi:flagellar biosynthesis anti-sigma factor FlgM
MKIDGNRSTLDTDATTGPDAARKAADRSVTRSGDRPAAGGADTVELSSDAQLLAAALKQTAGTTPVRTELVEEMKRKLAAGEIGNDSGRLADRLIDDLLER